MSKVANKKFREELKQTTVSEALKEEKQRLHIKYENWVQLRKEQGKTYDERLFQKFCEIYNKHIKNIWSEYYLILNKITVEHERTKSDVDILHEAQENARAKTGIFSEDVIELKKIKDIITLGEKIIHLSDPRWKTIQEKWEQSRKNKERKYSQQEFKNLQYYIELGEGYEQFLRVPDFRTTNAKMNKSSDSRNDPDGIDL